jgi:hypothetical protein
MPLLESRAGSFQLDEASLGENSGSGRVQHETFITLPCPGKEKPRGKAGLEFAMTNAAGPETPAEPFRSLETGPSLWLLSRVRIRQGR